MVIIQNTAPWTFFGPFAINPCPRASFDLGLDVFAPHSLGPLPAARFGLRMLRGSRAGAVAGSADPAARRGSVHDPGREPRPPCSSTGTPWATSSSVHFRYTPHALRIVG